MDKNNFGRLSDSAFLQTRDEWIDYVNQCQTLSHAAARVGTFIALRMNVVDRCSWWPVKRIAVALGCSTRTVSDGIAQLMMENLLVVHRPNRRANQRYFIRLPYVRNAAIALLSDAVTAS